MRILLQFPEGLKQKALEYAQKYQDEGHQIYLSSSKSFGGCDVAFEEARVVSADKIIHFGHAEFPLHPTFKRYNIPVEYVEYHIDLNDRFIDSIVEYAKKYDKVALGTVVQHIHQFNDIKKRIESAGVEVFTSKGPKCAYEGQTLGCDPYAVTSLEDKVDAVIFISGGKFHYLALHKILDPLSTPIINANPYSEEIKDVSDEIKKYIKRRKGIIAKASEGKIFGILVSTRAGQFAPEVAEKIKETLLRKNKKAFILVSRSIDPEALQDFNVFDAYINTACPRIADDWESIGRPVVNTNEINLLLELI